MKIDFDSFMLGFVFATCVALALRIVEEVGTYVNIKTVIASREKEEKK